MPSDDGAPTTYYACHGLYGCETGCCGFRLCLDDEGDDCVPGTHFEFTHPEKEDDLSPEAIRAFAVETWGDAVPEHVEVKPGKWYKCTW